MVTNMKDYFLEKKSGGGYRKGFRDTMRVNLKTIYIKNSFSNQLESDEIDTLQQRIDWWMVVVGRGGPIPNDVYDYCFDELFGYYRKAIDLEMRELVESLEDRHIIP